MVLTHGSIFAGAISGFQPLQRITRSARGICHEAGPYGLDVRPDQARIRDASGTLGPRHRGFGSEVSQSEQGM